MKAKSRIFQLFLIAASLLLLVPTAASAQMLVPANERANLERAPVIEETTDGWLLTPPGLERIVFIHYKKDFAKPPWAGEGKGGKDEDTGDYETYGKGVKWKDTPVEYVIDPDNPDGLTESFITSAFFSSAEEWDSHTGTELFNDVYSIDYNASWDSDIPDGRNELVFGDYSEQGVIAVTVVWGYFSGPPRQREIIEFDVLFDTDFTWGDATLNSQLMDLQNIATHEIGHGAGLADLYKDSASEETMYGYSENGEIKKRDLYYGDIAGIQELYGQ